MKQTDPKITAALLLGLVLSIPVVRGYFDGTIPLTTAVFRTAVGLALAYGGVLLVATVVGGYLPEPEPEEEQAAALEGVEDAVLVDDGALEAPADDQG